MEGVWTPLPANPLVGTLVHKFVLASVIAMMLRSWEGNRQSGVGRASQPWFSPARTRAYDCEMSIP